MSNRIKMTVLYVYIICYSLFFSFFPWERFSVKGEYVDKNNYLEFITRLSYGYEQHRFEYKGLLSWISNELGWSYILLYLVKIGFDFDLILNVISFFIVFVSFTFLMRAIGKYNFITVLLISALMVNPVYVDFAISQVRSAFALSVFMLLLVCYMKIKNRLLLFSFVLPSIIHTVSVIYFFVYLFYSLFDRYRLKVKLKDKYLAYFLGFFVGVVMVLSWKFILSSIDDRRAEYSNMSSSLSYMSFWLLSGLLLLVLRIKDKASSIFIFFSFFFLGLIMATSLLGGYASRLLALGFVFYIYLFLNIENSKWRFLILSTCFLFASVQWLYWTGLVLEIA